MAQYLKLRKTVTSTQHGIFCYTQRPRSALVIQLIFSYQHTAHHLVQLSVSNNSVRSAGS